MSKTKIGEGTRVDWTATAAKSAGSLIVLGGIVGVALADAVTGDTIAIELNGHHRLTKPTGAAFAIGAPVYVTSAGVIATGSSGNQYVGLASEAATAAANNETVYVLVGTRPSVGDV